MTNQEIHTRFDRQIILPEFGFEAQQKLLNAKVLLVGLGGLGCPAMQYLIGAGVSKIGIVDGDCISISNLHRQLLFSSSDIGKMKVDVAFEKLKAIHPHTQIDVYPFFIEKSTAIELIQQYDIVLDCTDRFSARYLINDVCVLLNKPFVYGALYQYQGQVAVFNHGEIRTTLRDLFPSQPKQADYSSCNEAGTLGMVAGTIGTLQALECVKLITQQKGLLYNTLLTYDMMYHQLSKLHISPRSEKMTFLQADIIGSNYDDECEVKTQKEDLDPLEFLTKINQGNALLIDVRNPDELPIWNEYLHLRIPLSALTSSIHLIDKTKNVLLFCHAGIRSKEALECLKDEYGYEHVYHLKGGLIKWMAEKQLI